jgi:hypothetical protein
MVKQTATTRAQRRTGAHLGEPATSGPCADGPRDAGPRDALDPALDRIYDLADVIATEIPLIEPDWEKVERAAVDLRDSVAAYRRQTKGGST